MFHILDWTLPTINGRSKIESLILKEGKLNCPSCNSQKIIKNGSIHGGKKKFSCKECNRQFVKNPQNKSIPKEKWDLVDKLLLEKIPIAGISRVVGISEPWLQKYINQKYKNTPQKIDVEKKKDL